MPHRAYGWVHRNKRAALINDLHAALARGETQPCERCGQPLLAFQPLDLGHTDPAAKANGLPGDRLEHRWCNRSAGDRVMVHQPKGYQPSREW